MDEGQESDLERAQQWVSQPPPLAPYWEGRTFDAALVTSIESLHSEAEKTELYERLLALLDRNDPDVTFQALLQMKYAFDAEVRDTEERLEVDPPADRTRLHLRLEGILTAIEQRLPAYPELLERFCSVFFLDRDKLRTDPIRDWLNRLDASSVTDHLSANSILAARILFGAYGETWEDAGACLLAALDHEDLTVRACAAYQIGAFCRRLAPESSHDDWDRNFAEDQRLTEGMAPLADYWVLIRSKELDRAGVAGAFWNSAPTWTIDADDWLLTLLEQAEPEPYIDYFPCNLGFDAHERYSRNPAAIQRLIDAGRIGLALEAATEADEPVPGLEPLLMELGASDNVEIVRRASWTLAYYYNRQHPNGVRHGFVQRHAEHPDYEMFLLFSQEQQPGIPYAVVLYPVPPRRNWSKEEAEILVDQVFPPEIRGEASQDGHTGQGRYRRGFVSFAAAGKRRNATRVARITIGYRSDVYWHPLGV